MRKKIQAHPAFMNFFPSALSVIWNTFFKWGTNELAGADPENSERGGQVPPAFPFPPERKLSNINVSEARITKYLQNDFLSKLIVLVEEKGGAAAPSAPPLNPPMTGLFLA